MALEARALTVAHPGAPGDAGPAAGPLDLALAPGEWLAIVGGNGSGKTALLLTLAGLVPRTGGTLTVDGRDPSGEKPGARTDVGIVFQEPETQFVTDRVAHELAFPLENLGWPRADIDARVDELLDDFDLRALALAPPEQLSGGEMQRVALAAAVAARPRYLLLDEPASYLDAAARAELERWTRAYVTREGAAVAWTECDARACAAADRVLELPAPRAGAPAPADEDAAGAPMPGPVRWRGRGLALELPAGGRSGGQRLWGGLDFEIRGGETWALVAPNGWGKTALLETLAGWREPTAGTLSRPPLPGLAYLAQFPEYQLFAATAGDDVGFAARHRAGAGGRTDPAETERRVARALAWVGLDPTRDRDRSPEALSLGERRRLSIAGVMIAEPHALLLDEPTAGLDPPATARVLRALAGAAARGAAVVLATHDPDIALRLCARRLDLPRPLLRDGIAGPAPAVDTDRNI